MSRYLIMIKPLAPYFFGSENTFRIGDTSNPYYISSLTVPPQTSIIGMLRYMILEKSGILKSSGNYTSEEKAEINTLIGNKGYEPGSGQDKLGVIQSVSPLFLIDSNGQKYIPLPLNHRFKDGENKYTPLMLCEKPVVTSHGELRIPENFSAKNTVENQYMCVNKDSKGNTGTIIEQDAIFQYVIQTCNAVHKSEKSFFKKKCVMLKNPFRFAFYADLEDFSLSGNTICYMGRDKSPFAVEIMEDDKGDIYTDACNIEFDGEKNFYYALSDIILKEPISYQNKGDEKKDAKGYAMVKTETARYLTSKINDNNKLIITRQSCLFNVIKSGSVFYWDDKSIENLCNTDKFGYNQLIKLGGKKA